MPEKDYDREFDAVEEPVERSAERSSSTASAAAASPTEEPMIDPDSTQRLADELPEPAHPATEFDAGTGQGTVSGPPRDTDLQQRPILDGSTQDDIAEATVPNPHRGQYDPATIKRQPALNSARTDRWMIAGVAAAVLVSIVLFLLLPYNPLWCGIGILVAIAGLVAMGAIRLSGLPLPQRLRMDAVLMAVIWLVPLAIFIAVLVTSSDEIWNRVT